MEEYAAHPKIYALKICALHEFARRIESLKIAEKYVNLDVFNDKYNWKGLYVDRWNDVQRWKAEIKPKPPTRTNSRVISGNQVNAQGSQQT